MSQSNGSMNWSTTFSAPNGETAVPTQVLADDDYVYVAGTMETSVGEYGLLLLKYNRSGVLQWSAVYDSVGMKDGAAGMRLRGSTIIVTGASGSTTSSWDMVSCNGEQWWYHYRCSDPKQQRQRFVHRGSRLGARCEQ
jgi:hypothetical protein